MIDNIYTIFIPCLYFRIHLKCGQIASAGVAEGVVRVYQLPELPQPGVLRGRGPGGGLSPHLRHDLLQVAPERGVGGL